jgi:hypothetical protein
VDQNWLNFVPLFFNNVQVLRHPGCNVAYWNLHERRVEKKDNDYIVNEEPLIFFHFSGYSMHQPQKISKHQDRFSMDKNPVVKELFHFYHDALVTNKHAELQKIPCVYQKKKGLLGKLGFKKLK